VFGFSYFDGRSPNMTSSLRRIVRCFQDYGEWSFERKGEAQSFENTELYDQVRVKDRMNREILLDYVRRLDIHPYDLDWYGEEFWRQRVISLIPRKSISLEAARIGLDIEK